MNQVLLPLNLTNFGVGIEFLAYISFSRELRVHRPVSAARNARIACPGVAKDRHSFRGMDLCVAREEGTGLVA